MTTGWILRQYRAKIQLVQPNDENIRCRTCFHLPSLLESERDAGQLVLRRNPRRLQVYITKGCKERRRAESGRRTTPFVLTGDAGLRTQLGKAVLQRGLWRQSITLEHVLILPQSRSSMDTVASKDDRPHGFSQAISEAFEPYMSLWVESQDK